MSSDPMPPTAADPEDHQDRDRASSSDVGRPSIVGGGPAASASLDSARAALETVRSHLSHAVVGRDDVIELVLVALTSGGHVLLEDYPGSGKTLLARALGSSLTPESTRISGPEIAPFRRVQFTPDLLPSDITGASVFDPDTHSFRFLPGPVFAHVLLADEINRTSPKVQSALLEAMAERQVTVDNITHPLDDLFLVIATQNPLGLAGTFPLPVPQLDRFLFKIRMHHIERDAELSVLESFRSRLSHSPPSIATVDREQLLAARAAALDGVKVDPSLRECLVDIARSVRDDDRVAQGLSTRSLVQALPALQARALLRGRDFVSTEDIDQLTPPLFAHRLMLAPGVTNAEEIVVDASREPLERASRRTLGR